MSGHALPGVPTWLAQWIAPASGEGPAPGTDEALVERAGKGEHEAFAELVRRHERWARTFCGRMLRDTDDAEDVAQEAFLRLWQNAPRWKAQASFRAWFATVLTRLCIDLLRRKKPEALAEEFDPPDLSPSVRERLEREGAAARMATLIGMLPGRQRLAIVLFYHEELSQREAAEAMGLGEKAFESLLHRARTRLRELSREVR